MIEIKQKDIKNVTSVLVSIYKYTNQYTSTDEKGKMTKEHLG